MAAGGCRRLPLAVKLSTPGVTPLLPRPESGHDPAMTRPDPLPHLHAAALAIREAATPEAGFLALDAALQAGFGHGFFTVMAHEAATRWNRRVYSSRPVEWPVGGGKPSEGRPFVTQVVHEGRPWTGTGAAAMRFAYPDVAALVAVGLGSGLNLPVRAGGVTLGVLNLLHAEGWYSQADVTAGLVFAGLAVPLLQGLRA